METHECSDQHVRACRAARRRTTREEGKNILSLRFNSRLNFSRTWLRLRCRSAWVTGPTRRRAPATRTAGLERLWASRLTDCECWVTSSDALLWPFPSSPALTFLSFCPLMQPQGPCRINPPPHPPAPSRSRDFSQTRFFRRSRICRI